MSCARRDLQPPPDLRRDGPPHLRRPMADVLAAVNSSIGLRNSGLTIAVAGAEFGWGSTGKLCAVIAELRRSAPVPLRFVGLASRLSRTLLAAHGVDQWYDVATDDREAVAEVARRENVSAGLVVLEGPRPRRWRRPASGRCSWTACRSCGLEAISPRFRSMSPSTALSAASNWSRTAGTSSPPSAICNGWKPSSWRTPERRARTAAMRRPPQFLSSGHWSASADCGLRRSRTGPAIHASSFPRR